MSLAIRERHGKNYYYFRKGAKKYLYLGPVDNPTEIKEDRVLDALDYSKSLDSKNLMLEYHLIKLLSPERRDTYLSKRLRELDKKQIDTFLELMSEAGRKEYLEKKFAELQTRLRQDEITAGKTYEPKMIVKAIENIIPSASRSFNAPLVKKLKEVLEELKKKGAEGGAKDEG